MPLPAFYAPARAFRAAICCSAQRAFLRTSGSASSAIDAPGTRSPSGSAISPSAAAASLRKLACVVVDAIADRAHRAIDLHLAEAADRLQPHLPELVGERGDKLIGRERAVGVEAERLRGHLAHHPVRVLQRARDRFGRGLQLRERQRADRGAAHMRVGIARSTRSARGSIPPASGSRSRRSPARERPHRRSRALPAPASACPCSATPSARAARPCGRRHGRA